MRGVVLSGLSAGLMYLLDPDRGKKRRTWVRSQLSNTANRTGDALGSINERSRELGAIASGVVENLPWRRRPSYHLTPLTGFMLGIATGALAVYGFHYYTSDR